MKVAKACRQCRESKRKCTRPPGALRCTPCALKQLPCSLASSYTRPQAPILPQPPSSASPPSAAPSPASHQQGLVLPSQAVILELVDIYITLLHDKPHSLFHEPSIRQAVQAETISKQVLCGILALSARHVSCIPCLPLDHADSLEEKDSTMTPLSELKEQPSHRKPSAC